MNIEQQKKRGQEGTYFQQARFFLLIECPFDQTIRSISTDHAPPHRTGGIRLIQQQPPLQTQPPQKTAKQQHSHSAHSWPSSVCQIIPRLDQPPWQQHQQQR
jgi:hypothetical protein